VDVVFHLILIAKWTAAATALNAAMVWLGFAPWLGSRLLGVMLVPRFSLFFGFRLPRTDPDELGLPSSSLGPSGGLCAAVAHPA
jgi:hypothetical protein